MVQDSANSEGLEELHKSQSFYSRPGRNLSNTSIESEALLDHRWDYYPHTADNVPAD